MSDTYYRIESNQLNRTISNVLKVWTLKSSKGESMVHKHLKKGLGLGLISFLLFSIVSCDFFSGLFVVISKATVLAEKNTGVYYDVEGVIDPKAKTVVFTLPATADMAHVVISFQTENDWDFYQSYSGIDLRTPKEFEFYQYTDSGKMTETFTISATQTLGTGGPLIPQNLWGRWQRLDEDEELYVSFDGIRLNETLYPVVGPTTQGFRDNIGTNTLLSDNVLRVDPSDDKPNYYYFREAGNDSSLELSVHGISSLGNMVSPRGLGGLGGIRVVVANSNNPQDQHTVTTDVNGDIGLDGVVVGDAYQISVDNGGSAQSPTLELTPTFDGQDLGSITITDGSHNFKTTYTTNATTPHLYAGLTYRLTIKVTNFGSQDMHSLDYSLSRPANMTWTGTDANILGTVPKNGGSQTIVKDITVSSFTEDKQVITIPIQLTGSTGQVWYDSISLLVYRQSATVRFYAQKSYTNLSIMWADGGLSQYSNGYSSYIDIKVPVQVEPHYIAVSGANYSTETKYALGLNTITPPVWDSLTGSMINEPNNIEAQAVPLVQGQLYLGYIAIDDIDFSKVITRN